MPDLAQSIRGEEGLEIVVVMLRKGLRRALRDDGVGDGDWGWDSVGEWVGLDLEDGLVIESVVEVFCSGRLKAERLKRDSWVIRIGDCGEMILESRLHRD